MNKEFISYVEAVALKELGFNEPCIVCYRGEFDLYIHSLGGYLNEIDFKTNTDLNIYSVNNKEHYWVNAPLYQQAFKWFREKHNLIEELYQNKGGYEWSIHTIIFDSDLEYVGYDDETMTQYKTYEEAELACLKKLIEIVKEKL